MSIENRKHEPWQRAENWQSLAIASAIITLVCLGFATTTYVLAGTNETDEILKRVQIVGAFAAIGLAIITFCTVVWRGLISANQADLQRIQIDRLTRQIASTDENNLAHLLQTGAELLDDTKKRAKVAAGIATLQAVATDTNEKFSVEAMNLLSDYLHSEHRSSHRDVLAIAAIGALAAGYERDRKARRQLIFEAPVAQALDAAKTDYWWPVVGVSRAVYKGGSGRQDLADANMQTTTIQKYNEVTFFDCTVEVGPPFQRCIFVRCKIKRIRGRNAMNSQFYGCDFSECVFPDDAILSDLRTTGNYFDPDREPKGPSGVNWPSILGVVWDEESRATHESENPHIWM